MRTAAVCGENAAAMAETRVEQHLDGGGPGGARGGLRSSAALALLLVALVGLGSRSPLWDVGGPPRLVDPSSYSGDLLVVALRAARGAAVRHPRAAPPAQEAGRRARSRPRRRARVQWWVRILACLAIPAAIAVALLVISQLPGAEPEAHEDEPTPAPATARAARAPLDAAGCRRSTGGATRCSRSSLLGGLAAVWYLRERATREPSPTSPTSCSPRSTSRSRTSRTTPTRGAP